MSSLCLLSLFLSLSLVLSAYHSVILPPSLSNAIDFPSIVFSLSLWLPLYCLFYPSFSFSHSDCSFFLPLTLPSFFLSLSLSFSRSFSLSLYLFYFISFRFSIGSDNGRCHENRLNPTEAKRANTEKKNIALFGGISVKINQVRNDLGGGLQQRFFCSTSLPLTSTRWFDQHIQAFHTLRSAVYKSRQHQEWISSEKFVRMGMPRIEPGAAGSEAWTLPLCYAFLLLFVSTISIHEWDALVDCPCDSWNMSSIPKKIYQRVGNLFQIKSIALLHCLDTLIFSRIMDLFCDQQNAWNCSQRIPISVAFVRTVLVYSLGRVNYLFFANCIFTKLGSPQAAQPCISM